VRSLLQSWPQDQCLRRRSPSKQTARLAFSKRRRPSNLSPSTLAAARSFGQVVAAVSSTGRIHRSRMAELLIAAIAHANGLTLYTRNPDDFIGLEELIHVITV